MQFTIVIPAFNEADNLDKLLPEIRERHEQVEIIVVDDCSADNTADICQKYNVRHIRHPYNMGNGASIKTGLRHVKHDVTVCMDADGQHNPADISRLLERFNQGYDMIVGERNAQSQASISRRLGNGLYNQIASFMTGFRIGDLTSGFRIVKTAKFREFLHLYPNRFSYPTTVTMAFFRAGYTVDYVPITARKRGGKSHINLVRDGMRFLLIIFKIGTLYSPLKLFLPISVVFFFTGLGHYLYTFVTMHRFTNMSALLLISSVLVFLIGLVSEQITTLVYHQTSHRHSDNNDT